MTSQLQSQSFEEALNKRIVLRKEAKSDIFIVMEPVATKLALIAMVNWWFQEEMHNLKELALSDAASPS